MRLRPRSARSTFLTSQFTCVGVVDIFSSWRNLSILRTDQHKTASDKREGAQMRPFNESDGLLFLFDSVDGFLRLAETCVAAQFFRFVRLLPAKVRIVAAEMPVCGRFLEDRPAQFQGFDDSPGRQIK